MSENEKPQVTIYSEKEDIFINSSGIIVEFYSVPESTLYSCFMFFLVLIAKNWHDDALMNYSIRISTKGSMFHR